MMIFNIAATALGLSALYWQDSVHTPVTHGVIIGAVVGAVVGGIISFLISKDSFHNRR